jgi:hypothetical protein
MTVKTKDVEADSQRDRDWDFARPPLKSFLSPRPRLLAPFASALSGGGVMPPVAVRFAGVRSES